MKCKVFVTSELFPDSLNLLPSDLYEVTIHPDSSAPLTKSDLMNIFKNYDAVLTNVSNKIDHEIIEASKNVKIISNIAVGFDNIDITAADAKNIIVTTTPDTLNQSVAEFAVGLIIMAAKKVSFHQHLQTTQQPRPWCPTFGLGVELKGKEIGIIGLGNIGEKIGEILHFGFGMKINYLLNKTEKTLHYPTIPQVKDIFFSSNKIFIIACPLTSETKHLIGKNEINLMPKNSILINIARGEIIDQKTLEAELSSFSSIALDVTTPDPLPMGHTLLKNDKFFITPHIGSATMEARFQMANKAVQNIRQVIENGSLSCPNVVNSL